MSILTYFSVFLMMCQGNATISQHCWKSHNIIFSCVVFKVENKVEQESNYIMELYNTHRYNLSKFISGHSLKISLSKKDQIVITFSI